MGNARGANSVFVHKTEHTFLLATVQYAREPRSKFHSPPSVGTRRESATNILLLHITVRRARYVGKLQPVTATVCQRDKYTM
jgi:hypothetical protein